MKKAIVWLLVAALTVSIAGCYIPPHEDPAATAHVPATEATAAPVQDDWDISWKKAFRSDKFPEGGLKNDEVAFARKQGEGFEVVNIPQGELTGFDDGGFLPRYSLLETEEPDKPDLTRACISYAVVNNYDRFVLPANPSVMTLPSGHDREYWWSVDIRCEDRKSVV